VLTLYLTVDIDKASFGKISGPHFFYTPIKKGLGTLPAGSIQSPDGLYVKAHDTVFEWIRAFLQLTTYEISIPALRDASLAPEGKTGLIISTLIDYSLAEHIRAQGWYDEFKAVCREGITAALTGSIYPQLAGHVIDGFVSTPVTLRSRTGNTDGAITGWAFTNETMPAITKMRQIARSVKTPIPHILQAGQWTYSPSGFPISILTGKLAADRAAKELKG
jgi:phytoene dehydrogenase-like protein